MSKRKKSGGIPAYITKRLAKLTSKAWTAAKKGDTQKLQAITWQVGKLLYGTGYIWAQRTQIIEKHNRVVEKIALGIDKIREKEADAKIAKFEGVKDGTSITGIKEPHVHDGERGDRSDSRIVQDDQDTNSSDGQGVGGSEEPTGGSREVQSS